MPEYKIDVGNSSTGPVGFVAYVKAKNRREALQRLYENTKHLVPYRVEQFGGVEVLVYLNADAVKLCDVRVNR
jgi:hypothetical protein